MRTAPSFRTRPLILLGYPRNAGKGRLLPSARSALRPANLRGRSLRRWAAEQPLKERGTGRSVAGKPDAVRQIASRTNVVRLRMRDHILKIPAFATTQQRQHVGVAAVD